MTNAAIVSPSEIKKPDALVIDVRTPTEHQEKHLSRPHDHIPLDQLNPKEFMLKRGLDKDSSVYILCRSGKRAQMAAEKFIAAGYQNAKVIEGGIIACENSGEAVTGSSPEGAPAGYVKVPSLERQVRIAAGALVVTGVLLGSGISSVFYLLAFAVGAGLVYSGVTDKCGLALVLLKAPWNKSSPAPAAACCAVKTDGKSSGGGCA